MKYKLTYKPFGEQSILIEWPSKIDESIHCDILNFKNKLQENFKDDSIFLKFAYNSILITYEAITDFDKDVSALKKQYAELSNSDKPTYTLWKIPVCYDDEFGIDLEEISEQYKLTKSEIVKLHTEAIYTVYFIGFLPGFLYLGGLNKKLHFPRKETPRLKVCKGAVAIGGNQTGVYPNKSPGGWNIIGNSPITFFNIKNETPCFASAGDKLQFYPVSKKKYSDIITLENAGVYQLESEVLNG